MNLNRLFAITLAAAGLGFAFTPARADDTTPAPPAPPADTVNGPSIDGSTPPPPPPGGHRRGGGGYILADLTEKLSLTPDQQKAIGGYIAAGRQQAKAVRDDTTLSKEDRRAKMMAIMQTTRSEIRADLTPDQQKIFDTLRPGRGGAGGPPPPPPSEPNAPTAPAAPTPTPPPTT
jgi:Spy/CpxP family protein refolding chaperone